LAPARLRTTKAIVNNSITDLANPTAVLLANKMPLEAERLHPL
jgi:hypothetical protein